METTRNGIRKLVQYSTVLTFVITSLLSLPLFAQPNISAPDVASFLAGSTPIPLNQLPPFGTYWLASGLIGQPLPPYPFPPYTNAPVYGLGNDQYVVDDTAIDSSTTAQAQGMAQAADLGPPLPGGGGSGGGGGTNAYVIYTFPTNGLWLQITNVANGLACANLNNATDSVYAILSKTDLASPTWTIEQEVWPTNALSMPFVVPEAGRTNLFLWAMDWTGVTENGNTTPDWWFWENFGTTALSDTNLDSQGQNTLSNDFQNGIDPNVLAFDLVATNDHVGSSSIPVQLRVSQGTPFYITVSVDDTNYVADANWQPFAGTNLTVNLGSAQGWHSVWVGLKGRPASAVPVWQWRRFKLDTSPPQIVIASPASTVSQSLIQLTGYSPESLSQISYDLANSAGLVTNQSILVLDQFYATNTLEFTTNTFQGFDIWLAPGTNTLIVHATDLAGNVTAQNYNVSLLSDTTPPVVNLLWPQNGMNLCGNTFTILGACDDPSATITAMLVDSFGDTNFYGAAMERNGQFWLEDLPLTNGITSVTLTAADVWTNVSTTNFTASQSALNLTINPVDNTQLYHTAMALSGTVNDPAVAIWANGVQGVNNGDGTWSAANVPVNAGGTASFYVSAYPPGDQLSPNTSNPNANPLDPNSANASADTDKPQRIYVDAYHWGTDGSQNHNDVYVGGLTYFENEWGPSTLDWNDGKGGQWIKDHHDVFGSSVGGPPATNDCKMVELYPPSFYPDTVVATFADDPPSCADDIGSLPIYWSHVDIQYNQNWQFDHVDENFGPYHETGSIVGPYTTQAKIKLFTGGKALISRENLWQITGGAVEHRVTGTAAPYNAEVRNLFPVPPQNVIMGDLGPLGNDGSLWKVLPDNTTVTITPTVNGLTWYDFQENYDGSVATGGQKYKLTITANGNPLAENRVRNGANYCVGQYLSFTPVWSPALPIGTQINPLQWSFDGVFVNESWQVRCGESPFDSPCGSVNYRNNPTLLQNETTAAWWVSGGANPSTPATYKATIGEGLNFANGQYIATARMGQFNMFRPKAVMVDPAFHGTPTIGWIDTWNAAQHGRIGLGTAGGPNNMSYTFRIISPAFSGQEKIIQTCSLDFSGLTLGFCTSGLDNEDPYPDTDGRVNRYINPTGNINLFNLDDAPQAPGYSSIRMNGSFTDYVMFTPGGGSDIYVTLGKVTWSTAAAASYPSLTIAPNNVTGPSGLDSSYDWPIWICVVSNPN